MKWVRSSTLVAILAVLASTAVAAAWKPEPLPRDQEIAAALEAGPAAIREEAGVYVLTAAGFELARESGNGFHCLVGRSQPDAFEPQCFDAVGSATLLEQVLMRGKLRAAGHTADEVDELVGAAWASGELRAPDRPGINYMLSERNRVPVAPDQVIPYGPHVMMYTPYRTNADLGGDMTGKSPVFVINEGEPGAYLIVPVPVPVPVPLPVAETEAGAGK